VLPGREAWNDFGLVSAAGGEEVRQFEKGRSVDRRRGLSLVPARLATRSYGTTFKRHHVTPRLALGLEGAVSSDGSFGGLHFRSAMGD